MENPYKKIKETIIHQNKWLTFREDTVINDGRESTYSLIEMNRANEVVFVVAKDAENNFYLVRQWRYPIDGPTLEFAAGSIEEGETPLNTAKRELLEELGLASNNWTLIDTIFGNPSYTKNTIYVYLADDIKVVEENFHNIEEYTEKVKLSEKEFKNFIKEGKIKDAATLATYTKYLLFSGEVS
jgi:ADP-ribose pyrophosphatase